MAKDRPQWLSHLSAGFKRHRRGRGGWFIEVHRDRLRVTSSELPLHPGEPVEAALKRRSVTLTTPPGPATAAAALTECCLLFDRVMAGAWSWPDPDGVPSEEDPLRLAPAVLQRLVDRLRIALVGEKIVAGTWERTYAPYLSRLVEVAAERPWTDDRALLETTLRHWQPRTRSRQMAHDRLRRLWKEAGWSWPEEITSMRGNGRAAASPEGVWGFSDEEIAELRARVQRSSKLTPKDLLAWDCLICFGLRPAELQGLELDQEDGLLVARVSRSKRSSKGSSGARIVPAVPPEGWPSDCFGLLDRWRRHGLPSGMVAARSPGQALTQQLRRLRDQEKVSCDLREVLSAYGCRHAFALRLAQKVGLHPREAAELMGHSPAVHLATYGRRIDGPALLAKVRRLLAGSAGAYS
jgi:integrase